MLKLLLTLAISVRYISVYHFFYHFTIQPFYIQLTISVQMVNSIGVAYRQLCK